METPHLSASFSLKPPSSLHPPIVSQPPPKELRLGFGLAPLHIRSRRYRNGFAWRLPSKTVLYHRPTAGKKVRGKKKTNGRGCFDCQFLLALWLQKRHFGSSASIFLEHLTNLIGMHYGSRWEWMSETCPPKIIPFRVRACATNSIHISGALTLCERNIFIQLIHPK